MPKRKEPGRIKKWLWRLRPPKPGKKKEFEQQKFVPFEKKKVEGKVYFEAAKQWEAAKKACKGNPQFAYFLSAFYRELEHPLLLKESKEEKHHFEQRQSDRERDWKVRKEPMDEVKRRTFVTSISPQEAAQELLLLGSMTPKARMR
jgi:hypothetical protein